MTGTTGHRPSNQISIQAPQLEKKKNKGTTTRKIKPLQNVFNYILLDVQSLLDLDPTSWVMSLLLQVSLCGAILGSAGSPN